MTIDDPERRSDPFVELFYCFLSTAEIREEEKSEEEKMERRPGKQETSQIQDGPAPIAYNKDPSVATLQKESG